MPSRELRSAATSRQVDPFLAMDVLAAAKSREAAGHVTYHLEIGQPGAPSPQPIRDAATAMIAAGRVEYTEALGTRALRARIAKHYNEKYAIQVDPERVVVTAGSSTAFCIAFLMLCEPGDRVALPRPGYPAYRNIVRALGLEPVEIDLSPEDGWVLTPKTLAPYHQDKPIRAVLVASPNNPTGTAMSADQLEALTAFCEDAGIWYISDEIYHGLVFEGQEPCALAYDDDAIIINSFSKYYCMTGWRVGWMVLPDRLVRKAEALSQNLFICPPALSQVAAMAAFDATPELEEIKASYARNRERLLQTQARLGLTNVPPPHGAFYMYWPVSKLLKLGESSVELCKALLEETGIATTPGVDFDPAQGGHYLRVSFAGDEQAVNKAAELFESWATNRMGS